MVASVGELHKVRRVIAQCPAVKNVIVLDDVELKEGEIFIGTVRDMGLKFLKDNASKLDERIASIGPDDYANISYTSGTTADPKGILLTHRNYTANVEQGSSVINVHEDAVMLIVLPLDHCFAHVAGFYTMMMYGGSIATVPVGKTQLATLRNIPGAIKDVRPHIMLSVPAITRSFKKNIEGAIRAKGPKVEKLFNWAVKLAIGYNREYYNAGKPWIKHFWKKPLIKFFDRKLFKTVRGEKGLAYWTGFVRMYGYGAGVSAFAASTADENAREVRGLLLDEFRRLASSGLDKDEFDCALASQKYAFDAMPSGVLAKQSALEQFLNGDALQPWKRREQLDKLTRADVNRRLKRDLKGVKPSTLIAFANGDPSDKKGAKKA